MWGGADTRIARIARFPRFYRFDPFKAGEVSRIGSARNQGDVLARKTDSATRAAARSQRAQPTLLNTRVRPSFCGL